MHSEPIRAQHGDSIDTVHRWRGERVEQSKTHMTSASALYEDYVAYEPGIPVSMAMFGRILGANDGRIRTSRGIFYALVEKKEQS